MSSYRLQQLAEHIGGTIRGNADVVIVLHLWIRQPRIS